jgi:hypothetical protein
MPKGGRSFEYDESVTLAQRLLLAIGVVAIAAAAAIGLGVREAWRSTEEERFEQQFARAGERLQSELGAEVRELAELVGPLCRHDPLLDSVLVDLRAGRLDGGRRLSISLRVPELMKALRLDELTLATGAGEILGAGHAHGLVGKSDAALARRLDEPATRARLRTREPPLAVDAHCLRRSGTAAAGFHGARHLDSLLERVGAAHGVTLALSRPAPSAALMLREIQLEELGVRLYAAHCASSTAPCWRSAAPRSSHRCCSRGCWRAGSRVRSSS